MSLLPMDTKIKKGVNKISNTERSEGLAVEGWPWEGVTPSRIIPFSSSASASCFFASTQKSRRLRRWKKMISVLLKE